MHDEIISNISLVMLYFLMEDELTIINNVIINKNKELYICLKDAHFINPIPY